MVLPLWLVLLGLNCLSAGSHQRYKRVIGGRKAAAPISGAPIVSVFKEDHEATVTGTEEDGYLAFRGIRFAEPPVGNYRFQRARKLRLEGDVRATVPGAPCPQPDPVRADRVVGSEDCLFLNVFTKQLPDSPEDPGQLPVMVWIHGGGFRRGSASQYGPGPLVNKGLVVVTIQYRLGSIGFLSAANKELPGNAGMFDMTLALDWVQDYISFFGGDPARVTLCGQGSGASSAILLSLSNLTKGLLNGLVALSGSALSSFAVDHDPLATGQDLARRNNCPESPVLDMVRCLQELPVETLVQADSGLQELRLAAQGFVAGLTSLLGASPGVDGSDDQRSLPGFIEKSPLEALKLGQFPDIPLLTGVTAAETASALSGPYLEEVLEKSRTVPDFWNSVMHDFTKQSGVPLFANATNQWMNTWTSGYQNLLQHGHSNQSNGTNIVSQLVEATDDALFNVQAFETANLWSQKSSSFLYSFDHQSARHGGSRFLAGLPIVASANSTSQEKTRPSHGDDLPFLFDIFSLEGHSEGPHMKLTDPEDVKVQDIFTELVAQFITSRIPNLPNKPAWPTFSSDTSSYLSISSIPKLSDNFRYCEMALWNGLVSHLQSSTCSAIKGIEQLQAQLFGTVNSVANTIIDPIKNLSSVVNPLQNISTLVLPGSVTNQSLVPTNPVTTHNSSVGSIQRNLTSVITSPVGVLLPKGNTSKPVLPIAPPRLPWGSPRKPSGGFLGGYRQDFQMILFGAIESQFYVVLAVPHGVAREPLLQGLLILEAFLPQCSDQVFVEHAVSWMQQCLKGVETRNDARTTALSYKLLKHVLEMSSNFSELTKQVASSVIPKFLERFSKDMEGMLAGLRCLEVVLTNYGGACGPGRVSLERFLMKLVEVPTAPRLLRAVGRCVALMPLVGGGGTQRTNHRQQWIKAHLTLCHTLHHLLNQLYQPAEDMRTLLPDAETLSLRKVRDKDPVTRVQRLTTQLGNVAKFLQAMLNGVFPVPKNVSAQAVLDVVCRGLSVQCSSLLSRNSSSEAVILACHLPDIHLQLLDVLKSLILCAGRNLLPHASIICKLVLQELKWTSTDNPLYGVERPYRALRTKAYETLVTWLRAAKVGSSVEKVSDELVIALIQDIHTNKADVTLTVLGAKNKNLSKRQKRKLAQDDRSQTTSSQRVKLLDHCANSSLCSAALSLLQWILRAAGCLVKPSLHKVLQETTLGLILDIQRSSGPAQFPAPYTVANCRRELYELLLVLVLEPHPKWPPPTHLAMRAFSLGQIDSHQEVSAVCVSALSSIEKLIHPPFASLQLPAMVQEEVESSSPSTETRSTEVLTSVSLNSSLDLPSETVLKKRVIEPKLPTGPALVKNANNPDQLDIKASSSKPQPTKAQPDVIEEIYLTSSDDSNMEIDVNGLEKEHTDLGLNSNFSEQISSDDDLQEISTQNTTSSELGNEVFDKAKDNQSENKGLHLETNVINLESSVANEVRSSNLEEEKYETLVKNHPIFKWLRIPGTEPLEQQPQNNSSQTDSEKLREYLKRPNSPSSPATQPLDSHLQNISSTTDIGKIRENYLRSESPFTPVTHSPEHQTQKMSSAADTEKLRENYWRTASPSPEKQSLEQQSQKMSSPADTEKLRENYWRTSSPSPEKQSLEQQSQKSLIPTEFDKLYEYNWKPKSPSSIETQTLGQQNTKVHKEQTEETEKKSVTRQGTEYQKKSPPKKDSYSTDKQVPNSEKDSETNSEIDVEKSPLAESSSMAEEDNLINSPEKIDKTTVNILPFLTVKNSILVSVGDMDTLDVNYPLVTVEDSITETVDKTDKPKVDKSPLLTKRKIHQTMLSCEKFEKTKIQKTNKNLEEKGENDASLDKEKAKEKIDCVEEKENDNQTKENGKSDDSFIAVNNI
uniref:(California timema) hypothetical protein n=1 Tax=Timema californicum TaxID=61474 RepID=A0A7R9J274_TIMCA|nr:unnamed protein product [Timema californicum]